MIQDTIKELIQPCIEDLGYILWGCEYMAQGRSGLLRIYIDKADGIGIEDCERVSHQVSALLDVEDPLPGDYRLEISSPGIPRPLFYAEQYVNYVGERVQLKLYQPVMGRRKFEGIIQSVTDEVLILHVNDAQQDFLFSNIVKAYLTS